MATVAIQSEQEAAQPTSTYITNTSRLTQCISSAGQLLQQQQEVLLPRRPPPPHQKRKRAQGFDDKKGKLLNKYAKCISLSPLSVRSEQTDLGLSLITSQSVMVAAEESQCLWLWLWARCQLTRRLISLVLSCLSFDRFATLDMVAGGLPQWQEALSS